MKKKERIQTFQSIHFSIALTYSWLTPALFLSIRCAKIPHSFDIVTKLFERLSLDCWDISLWGDWGFGGLAWRDSRLVWALHPWRGMSATSVQLSNRTGQLMLTQSLISCVTWIIQPFCCVYSQRADFIFLDTDVATKWKSDLILIGQFSCQFSIIFLADFVILSNYWRIMYVSLIICSIM